jgi:hypothetical protein
MQIQNYIVKFRMRGYWWVVFKQMKSCYKKNKGTLSQKRGGVKKDNIPLQSRA